MNLEDLQHIFKPQLDQIQDQDVKLFYMLTDGVHVQIDRHPAQDLEGLIPMLSSFQYVGNEGNIPRFVK
jgi:hypothetical protein